MDRTDKHQSIKLKTKMEKKHFCIAFLVLVACLSEGWAQQSSCLNELAPCLNYLNGTQDPPNSCCDPLKSVIESDAECLCSLVSNQGTRQAEQAGININEAQKLPGRCGQHVNPLACLKGSSSGGGGNNSAQNSATKLMCLSWGALLMLALSIVV